MTYDEIQIALVKKDSIICERNFIYIKPFELIFFFGGDQNPVINNLLDVKKLSVFVTYVTIELYIFGREILSF